MKTTVIGSFPYETDCPNWFNNKEKTNGLGNENNKILYNNYTKDLTKLEMNIKDIISIQENIGIDTYTNGEVGRENYIHFLLRYWKGIDFINLEEKVLRSGAYKTKLPVIRDKLQIKDLISREDWLN